MNYQSFRPTGFQILPPVVKNLLIINGIFFLATITFPRVFEIDLYNNLGLFYFSSDNFQPYQLLSHMFMHGDFFHLFFNMFALWMFGHTLERVWGSKRFFTFYFVTGLGAAILHLGVKYLEYQSLIAEINPEILQEVIQNGRGILTQQKNYVEPLLRDLNLLINTPTVGASGAVYGLLMAFGLMFPNSVIYIYFAIPLKAKYFVMILIGIELYAGISNNPQDNIAHYAHLGGMIFGFLLLKYWQKRMNKYRKF